jgi:hypothetical protein
MFSNPAWFAWLDVACLLLTCVPVLFDAVLLLLSPATWSAAST